MAGREKPAGSMSPGERQAVMGLSAIYIARMLGLFMLMPVLSLDGSRLRGATPFLLGLAVGIYGLAQALLQFPFGYASDRWGRKPVVAIGLALFIGGSLLGAFTDSMMGVVIARVLQGAGAVSAVLLAIAGDLTAEANRTKAMAAIGGSISLAYVLGVAFGPLIYGLAGLRGTFLSAAALGVVALWALYRWVPPVETEVQSATGDWQAVARVLARMPVMTVSVGIFLLQMTLGASFVVLSPEFVQVLHVSTGHLWLVYVPVMVVAGALMVYPVMRAERSKAHLALLAASGLLILIGAGAVAAWPGRFWPVVVAATVFFTGYNLASALLPSMMSRTTGPELRGAVSGVYSVFQFMGIFTGAALGGWALSLIGAGGVFWMIALVGLLLMLQSASGLFVHARRPAPDS
ncbi:MAG: MFS transporter [Gammaproteobacteria bacterium]|nr:MFS transporter [Gammaproteobacteria bacterium]